MLLDCPDLGPTPVMIVHLDEKRGQWDCINDDEAEEEELDDGGIWLG